MERTPRREMVAFPNLTWSLYNAFTEVAKSRSPRAQIEDTLRLTRVFRQVLGFGNDNGASPQGGTP